MARFSRSAITVRNQSMRRVRRRPNPAIAWIPTHDPYYVVAGILATSIGLPSLHMTQRTLLDLRGKLRDEQATLPYGLLAGELFVDADSNAEILLIDEVVSARAELTEFNLRSQLQSELRSLSSRAQKRGKLAIGWYVGGIGEDLQLGDEDLALHREMFPEPWEVVLLHDNTAGIERGAFVRFESMTNRSYAIPFFETLSNRGSGDITERRTALQWANYRPDEPVLPLDESEIAQITGAASKPHGKRAGIRGWFGSLRSMEHKPQPQAPWREEATARATTEVGSRVQPTPRATAGPFADTQFDEAPFIERPPGTEASVAARGAQAVPKTEKTGLDNNQPIEADRFIFINGELVPAAQPGDADENRVPTSPRWRTPLFVTLSALGLLALFNWVSSTVR
jgi:hypothetical protein